MRPNRILVIRPDRIGDVILSTPVLSWIKRQWPEVHLIFLVRKLVLPLVQDLPEIDDVLVFEPEGRHQGVRGFWTLVQDIRSRKFDASLTLQSHRRIALALFLARVPIRVGPLSKIHSYFFYNRGIRQHRSQVEKHEAEYNLDLLRGLEMPLPNEILPTQVRVSEAARNSAKTWLSSQNLSQPWVAIHPGMGGSALNWPVSHYRDLVQALIEKGWSVVLTGGPADATTIESLVQGLPASSQKKIRCFLSTGTIDELGALFEQAAVVVAPSTGPLHLAIALQRPCVTFYSSILVESPKRWGPWGFSQVTVFQGRMDETCSAEQGMKELFVNDAVKAVERYLKESTREHQSHRDSRLES